MSSRAVRRLMAEKELGKEAAKQQTSSSKAKSNVDENEDFISKQPPARTFAGMADSDSESDEANQGEEGKLSLKEDQESPPPPQAVQPLKKTHEKGAPGKHRQARDQAKAERKLREKPQKKEMERNDQDQDIDAVLAELGDASKDEPKNMETSPSPASLRISGLAFPPNHLNPDVEVRRKLGGKVRATDQPRNRGQTSTRRGVHINHVLVEEEGYFPPPIYATGNGVRMLKDPQTNVYSFDASEGYQSAQAHFRVMVQTMDPQNIVDMVQTNPFHVDALIQLHDVYVSMGQNETASSFLRRALYVLESWASAGFRDALGSGAGPFLRLDLDPLSDEDDALRASSGQDAGLNGAFYRALFLAMKLAGRRDCYDAAFSLAKLLLTLSRDSSDPTFALLHIDYYALKTGVEGAKWVVNHGKAVGLDPTILPNAAFSRALALRLTGNGADVELCEAMRRFPTFASAILEAGTDGVPNPSSFADSLDLVQRLSGLCATRQASLWTSSTEAGGWLRKISASDAVRRPKHGLTPATVGARQVQEKYARAKLFHVSDTVSTLPRDELEREDANADPEFLAAAQAAMQHGFAAAQGGRGGEQLDDVDELGLQEADYVELAQGGGGGGIGGLVDALRAFLPWNNASNQPSTNNEMEREGNHGHNDDDGEQDLD